LFIHIEDGVTEAWERRELLEHRSTPEESYVGCAACGWQARMSLDDVDKWAAGAPLCPSCRRCLAGSLDELEHADGCPAVAGEHA